MKFLSLSIILVFASCHFVLAQQRLTQSANGSLFTSIYKITDVEATALSQNEKLDVPEGFFHTKVDSFSSATKLVKLRSLTYGNYLLVNAENNWIEYELYSKTNVDFKQIKDNEQFRFIITDLKGNHVPDANVKVGKSKARYNKFHQVYEARLPKSGDVIFVNYHNVSSFFKYYGSVGTGKKPSFFKRLFESRKGKIHSTDHTSKYRGAVFFNKPIYKPLDTVKFKVYLLSKKGTPVTGKVLQVYLGNDEDETLIKTITPYYQGGYESNLLLHDSLKLELDTKIKLILKEKINNVWEEIVSYPFRYEDYELKASKLNIRSPQRRSYPGDSAILYIKATDENGLTIPDGRVEIIVKSSPSALINEDHVFIKDTLYTTRTPLDPVGETKVVLPAGIFPNADFQANIHATFLNSNNERIETDYSLSHVVREEKLKGTIENGKVKLDFMVNGTSQPIKAKLHVLSSRQELLDSSTVELPIELTLDARVDRYRVIPQDRRIYEAYLYELDPGPQLRTLLTKDSLKIVVENKYKIPFWYTVFSNNKTILQGYVTKLDTAFKFNNANTASLSINYVWAGNVQSRSSSATYGAGVLDVSLKTPPVVYPGQTVDMEVSIKDIEGKPVPQTDVTAYAHTSKFMSDDVFYPNFVKSFYRKYNYSRTQSVGFKGQRRLVWEKWAKPLGLDSIPFYKLINTADLEIFREPANNQNAVMVPFIVNSGEIERIHIIYVDDIPVYYSQTDELKKYAFVVTPGSHRIRLRTADHEVLYTGLFAKGVRTTISISSTPLNPKVKVVSVPSMLTSSERNLLSKYLILINDNFEGAKATLTDSKQTLLLNPFPTTYKRGNILVGPIDSTLLKFKSGPIYHEFAKQDGYLYGFLPDSILRQPFDPIVLPYLNSGKVTGNKDYKQQPLTLSAVDSVWNDYLNLRSQTMILIVNPMLETNNYGVLRLELHPSITNNADKIKNILIYTDSDKSFRYVHPGAMQPNIKLKPAVYKALFLLMDNSYCIADGLEVKAYGQNYYRIKNARILPADEKSIAIDKEIKAAGDRSIGSYGNSIPVAPRNSFISTLATEFRVTRMSGMVIDAETKEPMVGAYISTKIGSALKVIATVQGDGKFDLMVPKSGTLIFSFVSYDNRTIKIRESSNLVIKLSETKNQLSDQVVIRGYSNSGAPGMRGSTNIRGLSTISETGSGSGDMPLIMLDGKVFNGKISDLNAEEIQTINILKDKDATAIYGLLGAKGVIIITSTNLGVAGTTVEQQQTMRKNFSDYAIWQPKLITDENGKAKFTVAFPDDITSWTARVVAINGRKQTGFFKTDIKSFKTVSATVAAPSFALRGDSINVIGKLMNYGGPDVHASRVFMYNGKESLKGEVQFKNSHIDTMMIVATGGNTDSLTLKYTLEQSNGYSDGEIRQMPLLKTGVLETIGSFNVLYNDSTALYRFDPALGKVNIHAETSVFPVLLDEIEKIHNYEYLCNEQLASKLKALLLEREISRSMGRSFKEERQIKDLIQKLQSAVTTSELWGWWQDSRAEYWISLHAMEALLNAEKSGYKITLDKSRAINSILQALSNKKESDHFYALKILDLLKGKYDVQAWTRYYQQDIQERESVHETVPLIDKLRLMQMKQATGEEIDLKWLISIKKSTLFGNVYWGELNNQLWDNSIQNTLLAYKILKAAGNHQMELQKIIQYFLEQRKDGQWRNTYESSLILETILPELIADRKVSAPVSLTINKSEKMDAFPLNKVIEAGTLSVQKQGSSPVYFTAYQQFQNIAPQKVSKEFKVNTQFLQNGKQVAKLKAGIMTTLRAEVDVKGDGDYVMVEIPIPAGCSYHSKNQPYNGVEVHREYFKNKTSIFCQKLKQGKHVFEIQLMPRYSGNYTLNPAKAEMMYFPVVYGREEIKKVAIN